MNVIWEHLGAGPRDAQPIYDNSDGGMVAKWSDASKIAGWAPSAVDSGFAGWVPSPPEGTLNLVWSSLQAPEHWSAVLKGLLAESVEKFPDAIVAFSWVADHVQIAVARTKLSDRSEQYPKYMPSWVRKGVVPRREDLDPLGLLKALRAKYAWMEKGGMAVGTVYLHPREIARLQPGIVEDDHPASDFRVTKDPALRAAGVIGTLWGAYVQETDQVPVRYVAMLPRGFDGKLLDRSACVLL